MAKRALTFGFGGYADLDVRFGEFFGANHTVMLWFLPQHPYACAGPMVAEQSATGVYFIGQGDYRDGSGDFKELGPSTLKVRVGNAKAIYEVPGFANEVGGPVGYRNVWQHLAAVRQDSTIRLYLNGQQLTPYDGAADVTVPASAVPSNATRLRLGRRSSGNSDS